jgi:hypothetical protein
MAVQIISRGGASALENNKRLMPMIETKWKSMAQGKVMNGVVAGWLNGTANPAFGDSRAVRDDLIFLREVAKVYAR